MTSQNKRNIFSLNNKYQMQIVFLITAPLFVITTALLIVLYLMSSHVSKLLANQSYLMVGPYISQWFFTTICFVLVCLITFALLAFKTAYDLVNPFNRLVLEVDEFLITGEKRSLTVRPEDKLAKEVSDRFNKLIAQIPTNK